MTAPDDVLVLPTPAEMQQLLTPVPGQPMLPGVEIGQQDLFAEVDE